MRGFFFLLPPQCKDKDRRRRKLFAIWSINKNANSGKPFLSCDNGGVVIAAAQRQRDRWTHPYPNSLSLNCNTQTQERRGGVHLFLRTSFFVTITCFCTMPWQGLSEHKSRSGWPRAGGRRGLQPRSVNQSIGHRDNGKDTPCEAQRWDIYWWTGPSWIEMILVLHFYSEPWHRSTETGCGAKRWHISFLVSRFASTLSNSLHMQSSVGFTSPAHV